MTKTIEVRTLKNCNQIIINILQFNRDSTPYASQ